MGLSFAFESPYPPRETLEFFRRNLKALGYKVEGRGLRLVATRKEDGGGPWYYWIFALGPLCWLPILLQSVLSRKWARRIEVAVAGRRVEVRYNKEEALADVERVLDMLLLDSGA